MPEEINIEEIAKTESADKPLPTPAELKEMRDRMVKYYKEQNAVLVHQNEYEKHLADIEEHRVRRLSMNIRYAQILAPEEEPPKTERKLKTPE